MGAIRTVVLLLALAAPGWLIQELAAQQTKPPDPPKSRPVLIPDDQTENPAEEDAADSAAPDPAKAEKHFDIGLYYLKMKKYDAAIIRFREAIRNKPDYAEAKWKFVETLGTKKDWKNALEFSTTYLQDPNMAAYRDKLTRLQETARRKAAEIPVEKKE